MYASEQGILNEQMNVAIAGSANEILKEKLLIATMTGAKFSKDGDQWYYILGELPEADCVVGFGDTPQMALDAFYTAWVSK